MKTQGTKRLEPREKITHLKLLEGVIEKQPTETLTSMIAKILGSLFISKRELTFEEWQRLEAKPTRSTKPYDRSNYRDQF